MNPILQEHLTSAFQTFLATFLVVSGTTLSESGSIEWTVAFWGSIIIAATGAGVKESLARFGPKVLGGRK